MRSKLACCALFAGLFSAVLALGQDEPAESPADAEAPPSESAEVAAPAAGESATTEGIDAPAGDSAAPPPDAEGEARPSPIDEFFNGTTLENIKGKVEGFYAPSATMEDPFGKYEGRDQVLAHLSKLYQDIESVSFEVKEEFVSGDETVALWTMTLAHKSLRSGDTITIDGVSHVRFDDTGKVTSHRDYYDLGALLYENTPIVGRIVRWVKSKAD